MRPPEPDGESSLMRTLGTNDGLLTGRRVSSGEVKGLTILVEFQDVTSGVSIDEVKAMLNDPDYKRHGNFCSIQKYYELMSNGALNYTNDVVGPVRLSRQQSYYINNPCMDEALRLAIEEYDVDLSKYDQRNEGVVDALSFLYAGRTLYKNYLWPHNSVMGSTINGIRTHFYTIQSLGRRAVDLSIGTFAHETGHMLCRFPDLYDYGKRDGDFEKSAGMGSYCLMSSGNHLNRGKTPSSLSAYLRSLTDWPLEEVSLNRGGVFSASHGDYGKIFRFSTPLDKEFFLLESRLAQDLDRYLPSHGLAVYHCDTEGSNEHQDGTPDKHYQCALVQADGHLDLEQNTNRGDQTDLFKSQSGLVISANTAPSSRLWDGSDSALQLSDITIEDDIQFKLGIPTTGSTRIKLEQQADLIIPDNNLNGVESLIAVQSLGKLKLITVEVDITHSYRGDLKVELVSPEGQSVLLHDKKQDPLDNLNLKLTSVDNEKLNEFLGQDIQGDWTLKVKDLWKDDVGRLDHWSLEMEFESTQEEILGSVDPQLPISENDLDGVSSSILLDSEATLDRIEVNVNIRHTYRGDLQILLISPNGTTVLLHPATRRPGKNIVAGFDPETVPMLDNLKGGPVGGHWTLNVRDLAQDDEGEFVHWDIKILTQ